MRQPAQLVAVGGHVQPVRSVVPADRLRLGRGSGERAQLCARDDSIVPAELGAFIESGQRAIDGAQRAIEYVVKEGAEARGLLGLSRAQRLKRRLGLVLCVVGVALFVASYVASVAGRQILPFDPHHLIGQFGGGALGILGLVWATSRPGSGR